MRYWFGDKVVVRSDLKIGKGYCMEDGSDCCFVTSMNDFCGHEVTICNTFAGRYLIEEDNGKHIWVDEMFEDCPVDNTVFTAEDPSALYGW